MNGCPVKLLQYEFYSDLLLQMLNHNILIFIKSSVVSFSHVSVSATDAFLISLEATCVRARHAIQ